jgi:hypothetical protein
MTLPDRHRTPVAPAEITEYLLSQSHPGGRTKAEFFMRFGFRIERRQELADAIREAGVSHPLAAVVQSRHGVRYVVGGSLRTPDGRTPRVHTVWIVEPEGSGPRPVAVARREITHARRVA